MKPWRAALTSATASGNSTRMASRRASACSSGPPAASMRASAAAVSSTAVFSVSVANCSRCEAATDSACCSANSRSPRIRSSGSPPNGKLKPSSIDSRLRERPLVAGRHLALELADDGRALLHRLGERRARPLAERLLEPPDRGAERVEVAGRGDPRRPLDRPLELECRLLRLLDPLGMLRHAQGDELPAKLLELPAAGRLLRQLAQGRDRHRLADDDPFGDQAAAAVDRRPGPGRAVERAEVDAPAG